MNNFVTYAFTTIDGFIFSRVLWSLHVIINATYESEFKNHATYSSAGGLGCQRPFQYSTYHELPKQDPSGGIHIRVLIQSTE